MILRIVPSEAERVAAELGSETIEQALRSFRIDGALIIENIVDTAIISEARRVFGKAYSHYLDGSEHEDAAKVGGRRLLITIKLEPPFDDPQLFATPYLLSLLRAELDDGFVISAFGVVCSLPSAPAQHRHHDGGILFPGSGFDRLLPAAAITVGIPLVEMNEVHGTTALWLGSHRDENRLKEAGIARRARGLMHALGFSADARRYAEPKHCAALIVVPHILSAVVRGIPQLQYEGKSKAEATAGQE